MSQDRKVLDAFPDGEKIRYTQWRSDGTADVTTRNGKRLAVTKEVALRQLRSQDGNSKN